MFRISYPLFFFFLVNGNIVACRPIARQRQRKKQLYIFYYYLFKLQMGFYPVTVVQQSLLRNGFANKHVCTATNGNSNRETVFSVRSVPRCYK
jgi:hypothetical protein